MKADNPSELLPLVTPEGDVKGSAPRSVCHSPARPLHPVVHLHVFSPEGGLFLQRRPEWKDVQPGKWDTSVGGHVDFGESVAEALRREAREELGLTAFEAEALGSYVFESAVERELVNVFRTTIATTPRPSAETDGGRFWTSEEILAAIGQGVLTPNFEQEYLKFFQQKG